MPLPATALLAVALAEPVQWDAPSGCPEAGSVRHRVAELLGRTPSEEELRVHGVVHAGPPWRLELETVVEGQRAHRRLEGTDCRAVTEAAVLILAVSVDPLGVSEQAEPEVDRGIEPEVVVPPVAPRERRDVAAGPEPRPPVASSSPSPASTSSAGPRLEPWIRVGAGGEFGAIPGGTGGVRLGLALQGSLAFLRIEGSYWIDRLAVLREGSERSGARVGLGTASLRGGVSLGGRRVEVPLSVGIEAGGLRTRGDGLVSARTLTFPWVAGSVGLGVVVPLARRWAVWGSAEAYLPMVRPSVRVSRAGEDVELHTVSSVGARALAGLSLRVGR